MSGTHHNSPSRSLSSLYVHLLQWVCCSSGLLFPHDHKLLPGLPNCCSSQNTPKAWWLNVTTKEFRVFISHAPGTLPLSHEAACSHFLENGEVTEKRNPNQQPDQVSATWIRSPWLRSSHLMSGAQWEQKTAHNSARRRNKWHFH